MKALAQWASLYAGRDDALGPAGKIVELLDDPMRRAEIREFGRRHAENEFAWRHEVPKLVVAYEPLWRGEALSPNERGVEI